MNNNDDYKTAFEKFFELNQYPSKKDYDELSLRFDLDRKTVQVKSWFYIYIIFS